MSGTRGSAGTHKSFGSGNSAGTSGAASTSSGPGTTTPADGRTSGVLRCWCSMGVAEPEGCARWPGSDALTSRHTFDGVQHLWSLGLCADGVRLSGLGLLALCALLEFTSPKLAALGNCQASSHKRRCDVDLTSRLADGGWLDFFTFSLYVGRDRARSAKYLSACELDHIRRFRQGANFQSSCPRGHISN